MSLISFYPGPSRVYSNVTEYIYEAYKDGYLQCNHRSEQFMELYQKVEVLFHEKLNMPSGYKLLFLSSATECWEVISQSLVRSKVQCFYNGAFGEKWSAYSSKIGVETALVDFDIEEKLPVHKIDGKAEWLFVTQNETSNGTQVTNEVMRELQQKKASSQLVAVDATSSLGGQNLDLNNADVWFASVQKCFGLPAGMGVMLVSPRAIQKAISINENDHYNSFLNVLSNAQKFQTHYTPNILLIYLLFRTLSISKGIEYIDDKLSRRKTAWEQFIDEFDTFNWLSDVEEVRSKTVMAISCSDPEAIKKQAEAAQLKLGNGYGRWKDSTFRIANFPAIKSKEIEKLTKFLRKNFD